MRTIEDGTMEITIEEALFVIIHLDTHPNPAIKEHPIYQKLKRKIEDAAFMGTTPEEEARIRKAIQLPRA